MLLCTVHPSQHTHATTKNFYQKEVAPDKTKNETTTTTRSSSWWSPPPLLLRRAPNYGQQCRYDKLYASYPSLPMIILSIIILWNINVVMCAWSQEWSLYYRHRQKQQEDARVVSSCTRWINLKSTLHKQRIKSTVCGTSNKHCQQWQLWEQQYSRRWKNVQHLLALGQGGDII